MEKNFGFLETDNEYFDFNAISASRLKLAMKSMAHFWRNDPTEETAAMMEGTVAHCLTLTPERFEQDFAIFEKPIPESNMNKKENKQAKAEFDELYKGTGVKIITHPQLRVGEIVASAVKEHKLANYLLRDSQYENERGYWWTHESGLLLKIKNDSLKISEKSGRYLQADLKTCQDASPEGFRSACRAYHYGISAALYTMGNEHRFGANNVGDYHFVMVEKGNPNSSDVGIYTIDPDEVLSIRVWINDLLWRIADKTASTQGYTPENMPKEVSLGDYYISKYDISL